jgi:hypothetical protein
MGLKITCLQQLHRDKHFVEVAIILILRFQNHHFIIDISNEIKLAIYQSCTALPST